MIAIAPQTELTRPAHPQQSYFFICYPELASFLGSGDEALLLQRIHYWLQNEHSGYLLEDGCKWIYNGYKEWATQFTWLSVQQIGRIVRKLEHIGWLVSDRFYNLKRNIGFVENTPDFHEDNQRKWYRLDYQKIYEDTGFDLLSFLTTPQHTQQPKSPRRANIQNCTLQSSTLNNAIFNSEQSSIYKENQKNSKNTTGCVSKNEEVNQEKDSQLSANVKVDLDFLNTVSSKEGLSVQPLDLGEDSDCAPPPENDSHTLAGATPPENDSPSVTVALPSLSENHPSPSLSAEVQPEQTHHESTVVLPRPKSLMLMGVRLNDKYLLSVAQRYPERLETAVAAFLEYCKIKNVRKPSRALARAIEQNWQPEGLLNPKGGMPTEVNPPGPEQMQQLEELRRSGLIRDFYLSTDGITKVVMQEGFKLIPWWEFLQPDG